MRLRRLPIAAVLIAIAAPLGACGSDPPARTDGGSGASEAGPKAPPSRGRASWSQPSETRSRPALRCGTPTNRFAPPSAGRRTRRASTSTGRRRNLGERVSFRNCGVPQERTDQIAARLDECAQEADVLIVQGGINDLVQGRSPEQAASNLKAMVERRQAIDGLRVAIAEVLPFDGGYPEAAPQIRDLNKRIAEIAFATKTSPCCRGTARSKDPSTPDRMSPVVERRRGAPPSSRRYGALGEAVEVPSRKA